MSLEFNDYLSIQSLVHRYPYLLDAGDFEGVGQLFADADVYSGGILMASRDPAGVARAFRDWVITYDDGTPRTRHCLANLIVESDGPGRATARSYVMVFQQTDTVALQPIIGGDYLDRLQKIDGTWRFAERRMGNNQMGNLVGHGRDLTILKATRANSDFAPAP